MRRFCLQNVESILGDTKKRPVQTDRSLLLYRRVFITPLRLPAPLLTGTDFQQHILGLGNIWETFRACTAHSASMCQSINFYSLLLSFLFFRVDTNRFTCLLARSANFACKINEYSTEHQTSCKLFAFFMQNKPFYCKTSTKSYTPEGSSLSVKRKGLPAHAV